MRSSLDIICELTFAETLESSPSRALTLYTCVLQLVRQQVTGEEHTYPIILLKHKLIALILSSHRQQLALQLHHLLSSSLRLLVIILHQLLLRELLLGQPLLLSQLSLATLELGRLVLLLLATSPFLLFAGGDNGGLLVLVLLEESCLLVDVW